MNIVQTTSFARVAKKLHAQQKKDLDAAVKIIAADPAIGEAKIGDLAGVSVYKFRMAGQLSLLAYSYADETITLTLLAVGPHENFYRDLKR